jgi:5-(carboxyamino)imidazole ribonucleotide mutase
VAIDGAENAALLAIQMMGIGDPKLRKAIKAYKSKMEQDVIAMDEAFGKEEQ